MSDNNLAPKTMAVVRLITMAISWVSLLLTTQFGWEPLPFSNDQLNIGVTLLFTVATSLWSWYKNNPVTPYGVVKEEEGIQQVGTRQEFKDKAE